MIGQIQAGFPPTDHLADNFISFVNDCLSMTKVINESLTIEIYGDTPACRWCEQISQDFEASDLVSVYFESRGQKIVLKYVEHYIDILFNFTDGLKYHIVIQAIK